MTPAFIYGIKKSWLILLIVSLPGLASSQGHQVEFLLENLPNRTVYLSGYNQSEYVLLDSIPAVNGIFFFYFPESYADGMYRVDFMNPESRGRHNRPGYIEFVWAHESFQVFADFSSLASTVTFGNSPENDLLGVFREYETEYEKKASDLFASLNESAGEGQAIDEQVLKEAADQYETMERDRTRFIEQIVDERSDLYASRLIRAFQRTFVPLDLAGEERIIFLREHMFDASPMDDPALLRAPIYPGKIIEYLMLYRDPSGTFGDQETAFMEAVDVIMANTSGDPELRSFVVEYLLEGFESFGMERVQTYIVDTYVDETCTTDAVELAMERVQGYRKMAEGEIAEDIYIRSADDNMVRLSELDNEYTLVIFWATYCEHCTKLIPKLLEWYHEEKPAGVDVFAVSIDTSRTEWERYISLAEFPWINAIEPMGWEGKSAEDYNVYATPTMFLLDRQRRIMAKPYTLRELKREVKKLYD